MNIEDLINLANLTLLIKFVAVTYVTKDLSAFVSEVIQNGGIMEVVRYKYMLIIFYLVSHLLSCAKCYSFWFTLIGTGNLFVSALTALIVSYLSERFTQTKLF